MPITRCINIDWLEIYCLEPISQPHDPDYYRSQGCTVEEREYGTRVYKQMFKIQDQYGHDILEVRRDPKQEGKEHTVLPINACHIRLTNRLCYSDYAIKILQDFCATYQIEIVRIFRIDIALDFERFDSGDDPKQFLMRYVKRKYSKINQSEAHGHFADRWDDRDWNSISWGSPKSAIGTKFYNKTKELKEVKDKPYIREAWWKAGLVDHPQTLMKTNSEGKQYQPTIWRLEFSIRSNVKNWLTYEKDGNPKELRSVRNTLGIYDTREKLLSMFNLLQDHYFHFRHFKANKSKYECPRKILFTFSPADTFYKVEHPSSAKKPETLEQRLRRYLEQYRLVHSDEELRQSIDTILRNIEQEDLKRLLADPYSKAQLLAMQDTIASALRGIKIDYQSHKKYIENFFRNAEKPF